MKPKRPTTSQRIAHAAEAARQAERIYFYNWLVIHRTRLREMLFNFDRKIDSLDREIEEAKDRAKTSKP